MPQNLESYKLGFAELTTAFYITILTILPYSHTPIPTKNYDLQGHISYPSAKRWENTSNNTYTAWDTQTEKNPYYMMEVLENFANKLLKDSIDLSPEINKAVDENFWDLLA